MSELIDPYAMLTRYGGHGGAQNSPFEPCPLRDSFWEASSERSAEPTEGCGETPAYGLWYVIPPAASTEAVFVPV